MVGLGPQGERISVNERHIVEPNGRNHRNEDVSFGDRLFSCPNCPDSDLVYNNRQMLLHSKAAHADMRRICEKCGLAYNGTKHVIISKTLAYRSQMRQRYRSNPLIPSVQDMAFRFQEVELALNYGFPEFQRNTWRR
ncbi:hypothetical protein FCV25MIE_20106 [Fagus crenata]